MLINLLKKKIKKTQINPNELIIAKREATKKANAKKGRFMKIIIIYCLGFICFTNIWSLYILETTGYDASSIVNAINMVHGGELLICIVKKIIDSPDNDIGTKVATITKKIADSKREHIEVIDGVEYGCEDCRGDDDE